MVLFNRHHYVAVGLAVAIISTLLVIITGGRLEAFINGGSVGTIVVSFVLLSIWFVAAGVEHQGMLVANSYISIIGKSFYVAGCVSIMRLSDPYPWYLSLPVLLLVILVPFMRYPRHCFWAYGPDGKLAKKLDLASGQGVTNESV